MLQLQSQVHHFPFEYPFETAYGKKTSQATLLVQLSMAQWTGYGECTSIPYYGVDVLELQELLQANKHVIMRYAYNGPDRFWHFLHHLFPEKNFLIAALDIAAWDMFAKMKNVSLHTIIGLQWKAIKPTCYTIGIQTIDQLTQIVQQKQYPIYKLKVNGLEDLEHISAVRKITNAELWIDANASWSISDAKAILKELKLLGVTMVEQPFPVGSEALMAEVKEWAPDIDFIADESCKTPQDLATVLPYYDGVNIKLSKCGGLTPALQMMQELKKQKKKIMIGSMCESQGGANALAHLMPIADFVDIDGPLLLNNNNATLNYQNGIISIANPLGSGYLPSL